MNFIFTVSILCVAFVSDDVHCEIVRAEVIGHRWPTAIAYCPYGKRMTGGGGKCISISGIGDTRIYVNAPENDYGWRVSCDTSQVQTVTAEAYLGIDVEVKIVNLLNREQHSEQFLKLNPAHEVPVLVDGDFVLTESRAILAYIAVSRKKGSDLYPTDVKARARVNQRLNYDNTLFTKIGLLVRPVLFAGATTIVDSYLQNSKYLAGDNLTIADFSTFTIVTAIVELEYNLTQHPNLNRWYKQFQSLNGFEKNLQGAKLLAEIIKGKVDSFF